MGTTPSRSRTFVAASSQYLESSSPPATAVPLSIVGWFKPVSAAAVYELATIEKSTSQAYFLLLLNAGVVYAYTYDGVTAGGGISTTNYTAGRWNHAAAVFASATSRAAYLNGASKGTNATNITPAGLDRFEVGRLLNGGGAPTQYMDGSIAGVAVWTVALTDAEVAMLASGISPLRIQRSSLVFYAPNGEDSILGTTLTNHGPTAAQADPTDVTWTINSVDRSTLVRRSESSINQTADGTPDTCTFMARGFTPTVGQSVSVVYHNDVLFSGEITDVELVQARASARAHYRCRCIDATILLNRRLVLKQWTNTAVNTIVSEILSGFTSGFTTTNVQTGLSAIDFYAVHDSVSSALQRAADAVGARWKVRPDRDLYFRTTSNLTAPVTIDSGNLLVRDVSHHFNDDQIRNRVYVHGAGASVPAMVPVGASRIPVSSSSFFSSSGGNVLVGAQRPAYTGLTAGGAIAAPVGTWSISSANVGVYNLPANTTFSIKIAYLTASGVSLPSTVSGNHTTGAGTNQYKIDAFFTPTPGTVPANIIGCYFYLSDSTSAGAGPWHLNSLSSATIGNAGAFTQLAGSGLAAGFLSVDNASAQPVSASTAGNEDFMGSVTTSSTALAATSMDVAQCGHFKSTGGTVLVTVDGNPFLVTYTGISATYGAGSLTGIPASGFGSVIFTIASGTSVQNIPTLTGVTGIVYPILAGDVARISVKRDDATSQTAMAALEGGDGIHEVKVDDSSLDSVTACNNRGDAELTLGKDTQEFATFVSQDQYALPGASVTFSIAGLSATVPIATVDVYWEPTRRNPQRRVSMTTQAHTLYQLLGDLQRQAKR